MLLDSSAWIEFFIKSDKGFKVKEYLKKEHCFTSIVTLAEISDWSSRQHVDGMECVRFILDSTEIKNVNPKIAFIAGRLNYKRKNKGIKWGMIDSLIVATAFNYNLRILTKDSHFKDLPNVILL